MANSIERAYRSGELPGLHAVLVLERGEVLVESYFSGEDERWGASLGTRHHSAHTLHDLRSVTKSVVSLLYGIALAEAKVPALDESLVDEFPAYPDLAEDADRRSIQIHHTLAMKMGIAWNEDLPYSNPRNSEIAMERSADRYRYILEQPLVHEPGDYWVYNGGAAALIGRLVARGTGMPIDQYAAQKLFAPLGIQRFEWVYGKDGEPSAASGLRLTLPDLGKIGQLVLQGGVFEGQRLVPSNWLKVSAEPYSSLQSGLRYGYFWWLSPTGNPPHWLAGFGNGGQRLIVRPEREQVIVIYAGNYNQTDAWELPVRLIEQHIDPHL